MEILSLIEAQPEVYPDPPEGLSVAAVALDPAVIWQRIESYVAHRWTARAVVWVCEGPGCFEPTLTPATITAAEVWEDEAWQAATLAPSPRGGLFLPGVGRPYRFTASVGSGTPPAAVLEAFRRLAEFMAAPNRNPGASRVELTAGPTSIKTARDPAWLAQAMAWSGAGDLLRPFRRA